MKTKNEIWNSFIGKKILLINPYAESVEVAVVTGCDPDIGICLNAVGEAEPHTICLGTKAPNCDLNYMSAQKMNESLEDWFKMIRSGYFSYPYMKSMEVERYRFSNEGNSDLSCPYSM